MALSTRWFALWFGVVAFSVAGLMAVSAEQALAQQPPMYPGSPVPDIVSPRPVEPGSTGAPSIGPESNVTSPPPAIRPVLPPTQDFPAPQGLPSSAPQPTLAPGAIVQPSLDQGEPNQTASPTTRPQDSEQAEQADDLPAAIRLTPSLTETPLSPILLEGTLRKTEMLPLSMTDVLRLVEAQNLVLDQQEFNAKLQKNYFYRTMSNALPDVTWTYTQSHFSGGIQIFGNQVLNFTQVRIIPQVRLLSTIYPGGRTVFESIAEHRRYRSQEFLLESTKQEQMVRAAQEYYQLMEAAVQYENALQSVREAETQVKLNQARLQAGVGTKLDLMQAERSLAQQERVLIESEATLAESEQALLNRLNLDNTVHLVVPIITNAKKTLVPPDRDISLLMAQAVRTHPDIRNLDFQIKAARMDFAARASDVIPSVTVDFYTGYTGAAWSDLVRQKYTGVTLQSSLTENMGFALPLDLRRLWLQMQQLKVQRESQQRNIESAVTNAYLRSVAADQAITAARRELTAAQEAYRLATGRFRVGLSIFLDVLNAQTTLSIARTRMASTVLAYNRSQLELLDALGEASAQTILDGLQAKASNLNPRKSSKPSDHTIQPAQSTQPPAPNKTTETPEPVSNPD